MDSSHASPLRSAEAGTTAWDAQTGPNKIRLELERFGVSMHVSLYQHHVHVLIQVKNNDRRGIDRFGRDGVGLTDLAMSMSSMWPRRGAYLRSDAPQHCEEGAFGSQHASRGE
jgi:hypothetical protein